MTLLQHHVLALFLTAIATSVLGLLVLLAAPKRSLNQAFALYSACVAWWGVTEGRLIEASSLASAEFWMILEWIGVSFIAPAFLQSALLLIGDRQKTSWRIVRFGYVVGAVFVTLHLLTRMVTNAPRPIAYLRYFSDLTLVGYCLPAVFTVLVSVGLLKLRRAYRKAEGQRKTQMRLLFWSLVIGFVGGSPDWALALGFSVPVLNPFGVYGVPLYSMATTYAVLHHKLFDFDIVIRKSLVYSLLVTLLTVGYFGLVYLIERMFQAAFGYHSVLVSLSAFAVMALVFQPLKLLIQRGVDHLIFKVPQYALAKRLELLEQEVRDADKAKAVGRLAAGIAHEIKNPLTALRTFMDFLPERQADPQFMGQFRQVVSREMKHLEYLARGLVDFAKPQSAQREPVDLRSVLDQVAALTKPDLLEKGITLDVRCGHDGATLVGDAGQLSQAFLNLVLNARDAMPKGGTLTVETQSDAHGIAIRLADTGQGIAPADLPHLFEPFFTRKPTGTGLGLSIVQQILHDHGGTIAVASAPRRGTTFTVRLPL